MIVRMVFAVTLLQLSCALLPARVAAQDVPGIEICTVEKTMERRTSCLQSNVDFLQKTIAKLSADHQQKLDAANRQIESLKGTVASLQKIADDLQAADRKAAENQKKLWFIESHLADELTLDEIAGVAGISRFHLVRAFAAATGLSVMRYLRARRLSEAARALAGGAPDILTLALDADYGSHEAFTRAFRDHFGVTPEAVRSSTRLDKLRLQEAIVMDSTIIDNLQAPRFETGKPLLVAGLGERYNWESGGPAIP